MEQSLFRRFVMIVFQNYPSAIHITFHSMVQPLHLFFGHMHEGNSSGGAQGGHHHLVVGIGLGEGLLFIGAIGLVPPPAPTVETMGAGA